ncbi:hypothetical protein AALO_G00235800 [Alosa alosa]|uniref:Uncharacterized protein n=1 Tax=Alosa alosa TaxID=278164 RepID=A0AAV6FZD2_9TELE|nr:hypothetical protein AALO_G00235800 [Alosa alosa]
MTRKLFLAIVVFLVVGALVGESSAEDGVILSELPNAPAEALEDVAHEGLLRVKRGWGKRWKRFRKKAKKVIKGAGTAVLTNAAGNAAIAALG